MTPITINPDRPCRNGHLADRRVTDGKCIECQRLKLLRRYHKDIDASRAKNREWKAALGPEAVADRRRKDRESYAAKKGVQKVHTPNIIRPPRKKPVEAPTSLVELLHPNAIDAQLLLRQIVLERPQTPVQRVFLNVIRDHLRKINEWNSLPPLPTQARSQARLRLPTSS